MLSGNSVTMYFLRVLLVSLTTAVVVCAVKEVKDEKIVSEIPRVTSVELKSREESEIRPSVGYISVPTVLKSEIKEDSSQSKTSPTITKADKRSAGNSKDGSIKSKKSPEKLSSLPNTISPDLTSENSKDDTYRTKKSVNRQARFEQLLQNPQPQYVHTPGQTTTVCIVVRSHGHSQPVTVCGPQANGTESNAASPQPEVTQVPEAARHSNQQLSTSGMQLQQGQSSGMAIQPGLSSMQNQQTASLNLQQPFKYQNQPMKPQQFLNDKTPKVAFTQQRVLQNLYRIPYDVRQRKQEGFQYQMVQPSRSGSSINLVQSSLGPQKQFSVPSYLLNQNAYSSQMGNVLTSNIPLPLSLNCNLQPLTSSNEPITIGQYLTQPIRAPGINSQEIYPKTGDARSSYGQALLEREVHPSMFLDSDSQRSAGPMYVLPDGSPIEGTIGSGQWGYQPMLRESQDLVQPMQYSTAKQQNAASLQGANQMGNTQDQLNMQQLMQRNSLDIPWSGQDQLSQIHPMNEEFLRSSPEHVTREYLRQWDDAYHQQVGRSSEGPMDVPSVSYIPFYFHLGENQFKSSEDSKNVIPEKPLTEEELKKKAMQQDLEIRESKKKLDELKAMLRASEEKLAKATDNEGTVQKGDDSDKGKAADQQSKREAAQKTQAKRQTKKVSK